MRDAAQVEREVGIACLAAGLRMQVAEVEVPTAALVPAVLAHQPIQPALDAAGDSEVGRIDVKHQRLSDDAGLEPVRQEKLATDRAAVAPGQPIPTAEDRKRVAEGPGVPSTLEQTD